MAICPVSALLKYMETRSDVPGPFFMDLAGGTIIKPWFVRQIRDFLSGLGLPQDQYAGHSFRIGAATTAAQNGVADSIFKNFGRWQSAAFLQYKK